jgi:hypothetical protein
MLTIGFRSDLRGRFFATRFCFQAGRGANLESDGVIIALSVRFLVALYIGTAERIAELRL